MKKATLLLVHQFLLVIAVLPISSEVFAAEPEPLVIGSRRELFIDDYLIDSMAGVRLVLNQPHDEGSVLKFDKPWEGRFCGYSTVIKDGPLYRLYYRGKPTAGEDGDPDEVTCYAESKDGLHWKKTEFDLPHAKGYEGTNVILANASPAMHNFSPLLDSNPNAPVDQKFKALGGVAKDGKGGLWAFTSPDGIHWKKMQQKPVLPSSAIPYDYFFDSQNVAFWSASESKYVCYFRVWSNGIRRIARSTSQNFIHWSAPVLMEYRHSGGDAPLEHLYTNQTQPYFRAPHIYLATAARFMPGRQVLTDEQVRSSGIDPAFVGDVSDVVLMSTRGGAYYDRTFLSSFVRPGIGISNWVSRSNYPALNVVQTSPHEMSIYLNQDNAQPSAHLRRYSMRLDGFASVRAEYKGGEIVTKPIKIRGDRLTINFATSAAGDLRVEILDETGKPVPGFSLAESLPQIGNEIERMVSWRAGSDVSVLADKPIRLRFIMRDADLYALRFREMGRTKNDR